jgi:hypothetical protein
VTIGGTGFRALTLKGDIGDTVIVSLGLISSPETRCDDGGENALSKGFGIGFSGDQAGVVRAPGVSRLGEANGGRRLVGEPLSSAVAYAEEGKPLTTFKVWKGVTLVGVNDMNTSFQHSFATHCLTPCSRAMID